MRLSLALVLALTACHAAAPPAAPAPARAPLTLTYLGVAGWQLEADGHTLLLDPYFSRPDLDGPIVPDAAAIAARTPARVDAILIGHSHVDHLLDAPTIARATGAQLIGSASTAAVARASGVPDDQIVTVKGGEDYQFDGWSVRVLPSLHSALDAKHTFGGAVAAPATLPMGFADYAEGGTFAGVQRDDFRVEAIGGDLTPSGTFAATAGETDLRGVHAEIAEALQAIRQTQRSTFHSGAGHVRRCHVRGAQAVDHAGAVREVRRAFAIQVRQEHEAIGTDGR